MKEARWQRRIEMGAFALGLATIIALLATLLWLERPGQPAIPLITAEITHVSRAENHVIVAFHLENRGSVPAEQVLVRISAPGSSLPVEHTVAYLPVGMSRNGVATLYDVPPEARPIARIVGYLLP